MGPLPMSAALAAPALLLVLTACGSGSEGEEPSAAGGPASAETSASPSEPAAPSEPEAPASEDETPTVAPADGIAVEVKGMTAHAPRGWVAGPDFVSQAGANPPGVLGTAMMLYSFPVFGDLTVTTDDLAQDSTTSGGWQRRATRRDDVVIDGVDAFHVAGRVNPGQYSDVYGTVQADKQLTIVFNWMQQESRTYRDEVIGSVLASVDLPG